MVNVFQNWGDLFKIEFGIKVTKIPTSGFSNVFHFTAHGDHLRYGDRIPAFWISTQGQFYICSAINGDRNYYKYFKFVLRKHYQVTIQQLKEFGKYWYEIVIDGVSILKRENKQPKRFSNVKAFRENILK